MFLLADWARATGREPPIVLTVDHGLHPHSRRHAQKVREWADETGLKADVLRWRDAKPQSDVEAAARSARYRLLGARCRKQGIAALYTGHTLDDQAETFLLRLARGSGLDGLSSIRPVAPLPVPAMQSVQLLRPLLGFRREALRRYLAERGQEWLEDEMNADPRFARVRIRRAMVLLEQAGLTGERIADAARHLGRAREALEVATAAVLERACRPAGKGFGLDKAALVSAPRELALRALAAVLMSVSGQSYRPRFERLERLFDTIREGSLGGGATLHGCKISLERLPKGGKGSVRILIAAEPGRKPRATTS
ncbi:MAG: tRNA lysidine(34) synthetase TilS [Alphaproteobacteria bacterium]|nr:tRNA lysidine(34) synthetase TilS [Alphaproteobacteria bacterium]MBV9694656.1 tRNA lysidine(34) synthetase TilS [Alphaproteobacteria bacterium]